MPQSVNGIGTHYYGRQNAQVERGVCEKCGKEVDRVSYDTRLWVVILFIPIIPLGKKRVINFCPRCTAHRVMPLDQWNQAVDEVITKAEEEYRKKPDDPQAAVGFNAALLDLNRIPETLANLAEMSRNFADEVVVIYYVAAAYERLGETALADQYFERAYALDPQYHPARRARAVDMIRAGRLDEARGLLDFMTRKSDEQDPKLLFLLASSYQKQGDHFKALELFRIIVRDQPHTAQEKAFRRAVQLSEKAASIPATLLPPAAVPWKKIAMAGIGVLLLIPLGLGGFYKLSYRPLHVVNGYTKEITVSLDGGPESVVLPGGRKEVSLKKGKHQARVAAPWKETIDFKIESGFFSFPVYVLNPGGLSILIREEGFYSNNPAAELPPVQTWFGGERFLVISSVDFTFADFPEQVSMPKGRNRVAKSRLATVEGPPDQVVARFATGKNLDLCMKFCENWLHLAPDQPLAVIYSSCAREAGKGDQAREFLKSGLAKRPINIDWHRAYQDATQADRQNLPALISEYDQALAADPDSSALLYLRGRIEPKPDQALAYFGKAIARDPKNYFPLMARAYQYSSEAEFIRARADLQAALALRPKDVDLQSRYIDTLWAIKDYAELEKQLLPRTKIKSYAEFDLWAVADLLVMYVVAGRETEAQKLIAAAEALEKENKAELLRDLSLPLKEVYFYAQGKIEEVCALSRGQIAQPDLKNRLQFECALETADAKTAEQTVNQFSEECCLGFTDLRMSLLYSKLGNSEKAVAYEKKALEGLVRGDSELSNFVDLMTGKTPVTPANLKRLVAQPDIKCELLTALAVKYPKQRAMLLAEAEKYNFLPMFPSNFFRSFAQMK